MKPVYFYSDYLTRNYMDDTDFYSYMNYDEVYEPTLKRKLNGFSFTGKYVHSNYIYWLAKNNNFDVYHTTNIKDIPSNSILIFHYDFYNSFELRKDLINIQILSDKALIPFADYYITNNLSFFESKKFNNVLYLPEPIPAKNLKFNLHNTTSPTNFRFLGIRNNFPEFLTDEIIGMLKKDNINIIKEFGKNYLESDDHVFFFYRNNIGTSLKHSNRIFLSYITNTPFIGSVSLDDERFLASKDDILPAATKEEFIEKFYYIKKEENFLKIKTKLNLANKDFYKNYFLNEFKKLFSFLETL